VGKYGFQYGCRICWIENCRRQVSLFLGSLLTILALLFASASPVSALPEKFFGIHGVAQDGDDAMEAIARSGAKYYHLQLSQTTNVAGYDPIFQRAYEQGITILPVLYGSVTTGRQFPTLKQLEEEGNGPGTWIHFIYDVVHRYGFQGDFWAGETNPKPVPVWGIWNEPNLRVNNPDEASVYPEAYTRFARRTAVAIQDAQKQQTSSEQQPGFGTRVNFGNLFSAATCKDGPKCDEGSNYKSMNVGLFLKEANDVDSGGSNFTGLALHPYSFTGGKAGVEQNVDFARKMLDDHFGGATKEIWITELGWLAEGGDTAHPASGEALQAQYLTESFNWIRSVQAEKNIQSLVYYNYRDFDDPDPNMTWGEHAGLRRMDNSFRPAWYFFQQQTGAEVWPTWPNENLGGNITGDPAISSAAPKHLELFARGADGALWHRNWNGTTWSGWVNLGGALASGSGPGTVSWNGNRVDVVYRGTDNGVWQRAWGESSNGGVPTSLGGYTLSDPAISSKDKGQLQVFVRGADNALWTKSFSNGSWSGWETLGGQITSGPSAVSWDSGRTDVVARGTDNGVWHWYWENGSWHLESIGGSVASDPAISTLGTGTLDVFARGWDNLLWHQSFHGGSWWGWETLGTTITSGPGAVSWDSQRTDVVARAADWSVQHSWWSP
jgi:hypothetical protein